MKCLDCGNTDSFIESYICTDRVFYQPGSDDPIDNKSIDVSEHDNPSECYACRSVNVKSEHELATMTARLLATTSTTQQQLDDIQQWAESMAGAMRYASNALSAVAAKVPNDAADGIALWDDKAYAERIQAVARSTASIIAMHVTGIVIQAGDVVPCRHCGTPGQWHPIDDDHEWQPVHMDGGN